MFETLLYLVGVHAQVSATAESLLEEVLFTLVDALVEDAFKAFCAVNKFGMGGMLRVRDMTVVAILILTPHRQRLKSSLCNKHSHDMSAQRPERPCPRRIITSPRPIPAGQGMRTYKLI